MSQKEEMIVLRPPYRRKSRRRHKQDGEAPEINSAESGMCAPAFLYEHRGNTADHREQPNRYVYGQDGKKDR
jgi:hypothetical protein